MRVVKSHGHCQCLGGREYICVEEVGLQCGLHFSQMFSQIDNLADLHRNGFSTITECKISCPIRAHICHQAGLNENGKGP